jgi:hypothetical protein
VNSLKAATSIAPSSTMEPAGSSRDAARTPNGTTPAGASCERGGWKVTRATPLSPGYRFSTAGSTVDHAAAWPTTSTLTWSTTDPVLSRLT